MASPDNTQAGRCGTGQTADDEIDVYRREIREIRARMTEARRKRPLEPVLDHVLYGVDGQKHLSDLFGDADDLILIHNMGKGCPYCTLWADGFNGVYDHLASRASFVVTSPDAPEAQAEFAKSRGWRFPMLSHKGSDFAQALGFRDPKSGWLPGVSTLKRTKQGLFRAAAEEFSPGDDFCFVWPMFDLLPEGAAGWRPRYRYAS